MHIMCTQRSCGPNDDWFPILTPSNDLNITKSWPLLRVEDLKHFKIFFWGGQTICCLTRHFAFLVDEVLERDYGKL